MTFFNDKRARCYGPCTYYTLSTFRVSQKFDRQGYFLKTPLGRPGRPQAAAMTPETPMGTLKCFPRHNKTQILGDAWTP